MSKHIFIVEDEVDIIELISYHLKKEGYRSDYVTDGDLAFEAIKQHMPDLVLLDLMLPGADGYDICQKLRTDTATHHIPIIMLTARSDESDTLVGLQLGADDYITKPFSPRILMARIKAVLRRQLPGQDLAQKGEGEKEFGSLRILPDKREVFVENEAVQLTYSEFQTLWLLAQRPGHVFSRYRIVEEVHGHNYDVTDRSIDVLFVSLRKKLGPASVWIETIRGVGYRFKESVS